jgi:hypothetical protein
MEYYKKILSQIEARRHFIYVVSESRNFFPPLGETFSLSVKDKDFKVKLDKQGRIWANANLIKNAICFKPYRVFIFTKKENNRFMLACEHF